MADRTTHHAHCAATITALEQRIAACERRRRRPSAALAVALGALAIALGGGSAFAVATIGADDIQNGAVTRPKIADNAVNDTKIAGGAVRSPELADGSVHHADLSSGVRGTLAGGRIPSGHTVTGEQYFQVRSAIDGFFVFTVQLPGRAGTDLADSDVNFAGTSSVTIDDEPACTGTWDVPTAPPGKVCLYLINWEADTANLEGMAQLASGSDTSFHVRWSDDSSASDDVRVYASWAYTAP